MKQRRWRMLTARSPTMNNPPPTWMSLITWQSRRSLCPRRAPRLVQSSFWAVVQRRLADRDLGEGRGNTAGRAHNWCVAYLLNQWMVASLSTNASATVDGSPCQHQCMAGDPPSVGDTICDHLGRASPWPKSASADPEGPHRTSQQMFQLSFSLTSNSDLPVATVLPTLPRLLPPR
jgi:hypothetical protein